MPSLLITGGPSSGQTFEVESELVLGRENADLTIEDFELSRRHARIKAVDGALEIEDLGSLNGTWVNGTRIPSATRLEPGDTVKVGVTLIEVVASPTPAREAAPDETVMRPSDHPELAAARAAAATAEPEAPASAPAEFEDWLQLDSASRVERTEVRPLEPATPSVPASPESEADEQPVAVEEPPTPMPRPAGARAGQRDGRWNLEWLAAAGAFPFTVLTLVAVIVPASKAPHPGAKKGAFLAFFADNQGKILLAFALITLAVWFFLPYLGLLWRTVRAAEGEPAWISAVLFGAGLSMATLAVAQNAFWGAAAHRAKEGLSPDLARTLFDLGAIFYMAWLPLSVFLAAGALLTFQTGVFPRWLGWMAAVASPLVLMSAYPGGPFVKQIIEHVGLVSWVIWTVATGRIMMKRAGRLRAAPAQKG